MQHCTHLHSMFYPACLVECYTDSIYRGKNRKGQISRKRTFWGIFSGRGSDVFTTVTLTWLPARLGQLGQAIARIQAQRPADLLAAEKPKVQGLQLECSFLFCSPPFLMQTHGCTARFSPCCSRATSLTLLAREESQACCQCQHTLSPCTCSLSLLAFRF